MLHRIVENDDLRRNGELEELVDAVYAVVIDSNHQKRELAIELVRLVAEQSYRNLAIGATAIVRHGHLIALAVPFVPTAQHRDGAIAVTMEQRDQIFGMWSLARTAHSKIADTDHGHDVLERCRFLLPPIEHLVAHPHSQAVKHGERGKQRQIIYLWKKHEINEVDMQEL